MFKLRNVTFVSIKLANFKLLPATGLKKVGTGATKKPKKQDILKRFNWENI